MIVTGREDCTTVNSIALLSGSAIHSCSFTRQSTLTSITVELKEDFDTVSADTSIYAISSSAIQSLAAWRSLSAVAFFPHRLTKLDRDFAV